jgi:hypothetical protein
VPLGITEQLPPGKENTGRPVLAGPIVTASGLLFIASTDDNRFRALDAKTGKELWVTRLGRTTRQCRQNHVSERQREAVRRRSRHRYADGVRAPVAPRQSVMASGDGDDLRHPRDERVRHHSELPAVIHGRGHRQREVPGFNLTIPPVCPPLPLPRAHGASNQRSHDLDGEPAGFVEFDDVQRAILAEGEIDD